MNNFISALEQEASGAFSEKDPQRALRVLEGEDVGVGVASVGSPLSQSPSPSKSSHLEEDVKLPEPCCC
jgi:hypothetical protein